MKNDAGQGSALFVWDAEGDPPGGEWTTVLWRDYGDGATSDSVSIPMLVEIHAEDLRTRYLAWVYELGERRIQGRRLVDHLEFAPGFSYWWMTLLAEKCNWAKSPQIDDAIRLMAFENWAAGRSFRSIALASANQSLVECIRLWCARLGVAFEWQRTLNKSENLAWTKRLYRSLPHPFQGLIWLVYHLLQRWPLRGAGLMEWRQTDGRVTFISYLDNLVPDTVEEGRFESRYWAHLPDDLQREGCKTNWLHLYAKDALLPTAWKAADAMRKFNNKSQDEQVHVTLDSFLDARVVFRTLFDWIRLAWTGRRLHPALSSSPDTALDLWPFFEEDWRRSMSGATAMNNALFLNLLESALEFFPKQRVGVYLQENQGWEFALIHAWKAAGHGRLIGSPHSTVRFWDMRYFFDPRSYNRTDHNDLPLPDQVALNGAEAMEAYVAGGYPEAALVEVEALRYLYLKEINDQSKPVRAPSALSLRVLVLGDSLLKNTHEQMRLLEKAVQFLPEGAICSVKPHPNCPVQPEDYPGLTMDVTMEAISKLLTGCDVAYTSAVTSSAVEAYCAGIPVVSVLNMNTLNLSPLRGRDGVFFISTPEELASALIATVSAPRLTPRPQDYFTLDSKLPRWRKLVQEAPSVSGNA